MPRLYVVYDSNVYRTLGAAAFDATLALEANHSVVAWASYFVYQSFWPISRTLRIHRMP
jgi:hypothetical protein